MSKAMGRTIVALVAAILGVLVYVNMIEPSNAAADERARCNAVHGPLDCALKDMP